MNVKYIFHHYCGYTQTIELDWTHYHEALGTMTWAQSKKAFPGYLTPEQADELVSGWNDCGIGGRYWWRSEDSPER